MGSAEPFFEAEEGMLLQGKITRPDHLHASRKKLRTKPCSHLRKQALAPFQELQLADLPFPASDHVYESFVLQFYNASDANERCSIQKGKGHPLLDSEADSVAKHPVEINARQGFAARTCDKQVKIAGEEIPGLFIARYPSPTQGANDHQLMEGRRLRLFQLQEIVDTQQQFPKTCKRDVLRRTRLSVAKSQFCHKQELFFVDQDIAASCFDAAIDLARYFWRAEIPGEVALLGMQGIKIPGRIIQHDAHRADIDEHRFCRQR